MKLCGTVSLCRKSREGSEAVKSNENVLAPKPAVAYDPLLAATKTLRLPASRNTRLPHSRMNWQRAWRQKRVVTRASANRVRGYAKKPRGEKGL